MRSRPRRLALALVLAAHAALVGGCQRSPEAGKPSVPAPKTAAPVRDAIPSDQIGPVLAAHLRGVGHMERYEYALATDEFRKVHQLAPGWIPGSINLAIALLNQTGEEQARAAAQPPAESNFDEALRLLGAVLDRDPKNPHAQYCRGIILQQQGKLAEAHRAFQAVTEIDPTDALAWFWLGDTLTDADLPDSLSGQDRLIARAEAQAKFFGKALECNPYLGSALNRLQLALGILGRFGKKPELLQKQQDLIARFHQLNPFEEKVPPPTGEMAEKVYGSMGRYAAIIDPAPARDRPAGAGRAPRFDRPRSLNVTLPEGQRWARASDFQEGKLAVLGRARARFGAAVAAFDADGDGKLDLYLAAAVHGPAGIRDALLLNRGDGRFEDATHAFGLPDDRASLAVAAGDFDADRRIDLFLCEVGQNRLLRNTGKTFEDVTAKLDDTKPDPLSVAARWLDLDQDGDLDLYVINYTDAAHADATFHETGPRPPGLANRAYRNDGQAPPESGATAASRAPVAVAVEPNPGAGGLSIAFSRWQGDDAKALEGGAQNHVGLAALDLEDDRDIDLVLATDGAAPSAVLNDRMGHFHNQPLPDLESRSPLSGLLVTDFDRDGRADLVAVSPTSRVTAWKNAKPSSSAASNTQKFAFEFWPTDARLWRSAIAADLDLDAWPDLLGLPVPAEAEQPAWARNEGNRLAPSPLPIGPDEPAPLVGLTLADLVGDPLPDLLLIRDGEGPRLATNLGNGHQWLALDLGGRWRVRPEFSRTNPHGLGLRLTVEGPGIAVPYDHTTNATGPAQSVTPVVLGLGPEVKGPLIVRMRWPDGVLQCELNYQANQRYRLVENNRKTGSCPVLFTFDGTRYRCIGDFLGGGGLGYLVSPGVFSQPDRDESIAIEADQLRPVDGLYRLAIVEPMDELAYLDRLELQVVDRPPGIHATPDERFAPGGHRPTGDLIAWSESIAPVRSTDLQGRDVTDLLRARDRRTVDDYRRLDGWIGYAEGHGIVLDFGARLANFRATDRLVLCLDGWVEYPYSQTNYAASTAGVPLRPPVLERRRDDGTWALLDADPGYPAGLPRRTTLDLTGKLTGPRCVLRLRTNMECAWDRAFIARCTPTDDLKITSLPVARADLGYRGYLREVSPDGRPPFLYQYDQVDPAPLAQLAGHLTRFGDVLPLLLEDDDQLCLIGPGDEVRLEFDARTVPRLPDGWTRSFVLKAVGYCKDADPFTAGSDHVEPLPWRQMGPYPFGPEGHRPLDPAYRAYLRAYQTRAVGRYRAGD